MAVRTGHTSRYFPPFIVCPALLCADDAQSLRLGTYASLANELLEKDKAYRCFCSPEEIQKYGAEFSGSAGRPSCPRVCSSLQHDESAERAHRGDPYVVRFKSPSKPISFRDLAYGDNMNYPAQTDFIIMKRDGFPTYHLANVVDDHLMEITHVIRGAVRNRICHHTGNLC